MSSLDIINYEDHVHMPSETDITVVATKYALGQYIYSIIFQTLGYGGELLFAQLEHELGYPARHITSSESQDQFR